MAWESGKIAVQRPEDLARHDVREFCATNSSWVVEGCYGNLVSTALEFEPWLLFLNPGEEQCLANCRGRPWESHKYSSMAEQNQRLPFLLSWVGQYYTRDGDMSLRSHVALFSAYRGRRSELKSLPGLDPPSRDVIEWVTETRQSV